MGTNHNGKDRAIWQTQRWTNANKKQVLVPIFGNNPPDAHDAPPPYAQVQPQGADSTPEDGATVNIQPLADKDGVIITVQPPKVPQNEKLPHVPCDIALLIDVSGSMGVDALAPGDDERTGLSVLDLVKHACLTIMSTMTEHDRLALVTFSNGSKVLQPLTEMTEANKEIAREKVKNMKLESCTNLWHGLRDGIKLFKDEENTGRVPAVMVLTDGVPNHMCPPKGYVPALKEMGEIVPSIHTFGFGYTLRSGLLKSIAEFGGGNYAFIPDAGMIGTVFIHAVANLQSTYANTAHLRLTYPDIVTIQQTMGTAVGLQEPVQAPGGNFELNIPLGSLQYGQSRDIYLQWKSSSADNDVEPSFLNVALQYNRMTDIEYVSHCSRDLMDLSFTTLSDAEAAFHVSRSRVCAFLAELFPIDHLGEHRLSPKLQRDAGLKEKQAQAEDLARSLPAAHFPDDARCSALMQDLSGPEPLGQVSLALSDPKYLSRWGQHYLPSLHGAHARQACNSFKDPGPQQYGNGSPLFTRCRDALNSAFDELPPPEPSNPVPAPGQDYSYALAYGGRGYFEAARRGGGFGLGLGGHGRGPPQPPPRREFSMRAFNSSSAPCFAGRTPVRLAAAGGKGGSTTTRISALRRGDVVVTPLGPRRVTAVLVTPVRGHVMVRLRGVLVTPWHPVAVAGRDRGTDSGWVFPAQMRSRELVRYTGAIYSVLLERDGDVDAHAIALGGEREGAVPFWGVTLGHGMVEARGRDDVRAHAFFGSYDRVLRSLQALHPRRNGVVYGGGVRRSEGTGLVTGFKPYRQRHQGTAKPPPQARLFLLRRRRPVLRGQKACKAVAC